ncbi:MAG: hypothetical protein KF857_05450 [Fimbriimonadaceae bacterium]|nr:hypothetical protein [Fimbriimonadaceae bacterium]
MAAIRISISVVLGVLLASCGPAPRDWRGEWVGELPASTTTGPDDTVAKTLRAVKLTVREDGSFVLVRGGIPAEGEVLSDSPGLTLRFHKVLGQPMDRQPPEVKRQYADVRLEPLDDGSAKLVDPADFNRDPVRLVRTKPSADDGRTSG